MRQCSEEAIVPDEIDKNVPQEPSAPAAQKDKAMEIAGELVGAKEWKSSKVGYLTGFTAISNIAGAFIGGVAQAFGRVALTWTLVTKSDNLPSLPEVDPASFDGRQRFSEAMRLHRRKETEITRAKINTRRSFFLYAGIAVFAVAYLVYGFATREHMALTTLALHLAPIPLFSALAFKASYYNWMFRLRTLDGPMKFLKSKDFLPTT